MKRKKYKLIIMLCLTLSLTLLSYEIFHIKKVESQEIGGTAKSNDIIIELIEEHREEELIQNITLEQKYINLVFKKDQNYISYLVDYQSGKLLEIEDLIKENTSFQAKIKELLNLKYPKFIVDIINRKDGSIAYEFRDNELIIHYSNFKIEPMPAEELFLIVDYNEIKDMLNFSASIKETSTKENGYDYKSEKKTVALTFDDGPNLKTTGKLIELLEQNKMHATFFMVGNRMSSAEELIKTVLEKGNEIGSHSYKHGNMTRLSKDELIEEERQTNQIYKEITGIDLTLLRPPYGNINQMMRENLNYTFVNWSLDTEDWRYRDANHVYKEVLDNIEDGSIILMHDLYESTVEAVEKLLPELYARGYQVTTVTELAKLKGVNLKQKETYRYIR